MIAIDLSKQQTLTLNADPRAIQQINFTTNLDSNDGNTTMFFIIEEAKDLSQGTVKVLRMKFP